MKAGFFKTCYLMLRCGWLMLRISMAGVYYSLRGELTRRKVDELLHHWSREMLGSVKLHYHLENPYHVNFSDGRSYVLMANHSSLFDIPLAYATLHSGSFRMVGKKELFKIPLFGAAMRAAEVPSINRQNRTQAIQDLAVVRQRLESGLAMWFFPEGTRSKDGKMLPLKKGAFILAIEMGAMIVPIGIRGAHSILPKNTWNFHLNQTASVHVGKPIDARDYTLETRDALIAKVTAVMHELVGEDSSVPSSHPRQLP